MLSLTSSQNTGKKQQQRHAIVFPGFLHGAGFLCRFDTGNELIWEKFGLGNGVITPDPLLGPSLHGVAW